jgi:hypothetical protein
MTGTPLLIGQIITVIVFVAIFVGLCAWLLFPRVGPPPPPLPGEEPRTPVRRPPPPPDAGGGPAG